MNREIVFREYSDNGDINHETRVPLSFESGYKAIQLAQQIVDTLGYERRTDSSLFGGYWVDPVTLAKTIEIY